MKNLTFLFLLFATQAYPQDSFIKLNHHEPSNSDEDLKQLDTYFEGRRLLGLGESTHGTHEFFTMRHRLIQYLVENHGFNTIFMEADYANSLMINEYISGKGGIAKDAVDNLNLWPWETFEFVELVEWLKVYNQSNLTNMIAFVGVDVQKIDETVLRLEKLKDKYELALRADEVISATDFYKLGKKEALELRLTEIALYEAVDVADFSKEDQYEYRWLLRHLNQILSEQLEKKSRQNTYRDKMMAQNILEHLKADDKLKGVFWAHNGHIAYLFDEKKEDGVAGGFLKQHLGEQYFIVGQEFDYGSFNARVKPEVYSKSYANWELTSVKVVESPDGSFAANYRSILHPIIFVPFDKLPDEEEVYINTIGAIYFTNKEGEASEYLRRNHHGREAFDAMILIKESTPTRLLKKE